MEVRQLLRDDPAELFAPVQRLFHDMHAYMDSVGLAYGLVPGGAAMWLDAARRSLGKLNSIFVAVEGDVVLGFSAGNVRVLPPHLGSRKIGFVSFVYVDPAWRAKGAARQLAEALEAWFREQNVSDVELEVLPRNAAAVAFWRRLGFEVDLLRMGKR